MIRTETSKLRALRSKTDQQLFEMLTRTLDQARDLAQDAATRRNAEEGFAEVRRLLPLLSRFDRRTVEARLEEAVALLGPRTRVACF